jgi:MFS transporter, PHS family, inorganic phosphate transporter
LLQIAAEVFPTKYRCTCHGISAAAGKLGSIIAQVFLTYVKFGPKHQGVNESKSPWLGAVLLVYVFPPFFHIVPEHPSSRKDGQVGEEEKLLTFHLFSHRFTVWMAGGAIITKVWVPNPVDVWGRSRTLEDLGCGKAARKRMEREEVQFWRAFTPGSPGP